MMLTRVPEPTLRPFVTALWATRRPATAGVGAGIRERVLPTGRMHLAFSLSGRDFRLFDDIDDDAGRRAGEAVIGGARCALYLKDISGPSQSIGAELRPGVCELLFGVHAGELAGRHTPLDALWGRVAGATLERLLDAGSPERQMDVLERVLAARLGRVRALHPAVAHALRRFTVTADVRETVRETGYSHRRFLAVFQRAVGLTPKRYCRVLRFGRVLERFAACPAMPLTDLAQFGDYSDQAHFSREFREFAGITPGEYRRLLPPRPHHVPAAPG